jgi:DNA-binding response OmpR family regulator
LLRRSKTEASIDDANDPVSLTGVRVLVADDHEQGSEITRRVLERAGCSVDRAQDHDDAMARLAISKPPFACVIVDFDDRSSLGLQLLEAIRASTDDDIVATPVVMCADVDTNRRFSWQSGADGFIVRPFHIEDLLGCVRDAVLRSSDERARFRREQAGVVGG